MFWAHTFEESLSSSAAAGASDVMSMVCGTSARHPCLGAPARSGRNAALTFCTYMYVYAVQPAAG